MAADRNAFGALAPGWFDRAIIACTSRLPENWLGLRLAILLRRAVTTRLAYPDGALDVERWGMRLRLHPRDNGCEKNLLFTPQMYEPVELREIAAEIARGPQERSFVFVDIGANVGLFSLFAASQAPGARIFAIEPEPGNLDRLDFNVAANPEVEINIIPHALGDEAGELAIELDRRDRGGSRTKKKGEAASDAPLVASRPLLDVLTAEDVDHVDALKIDVGGSEDAVLYPYFRDAPSRMWPRLIIIEDSRGSWRIDLMALLAASGYVIAARSKQNIALRRDDA
jgi:FkbM family methyltransferase